MPRRTLRGSCPAKEPHLLDRDLSRGAGQSFPWDVVIAITGMLPSWDGAVGQRAETTRGDSNLSPQVQVLFPGEVYVDPFQQLSFI